MISPFYFIAIPSLLALTEYLWEKYYLKIQRSPKELSLNLMTFGLYFFWNAFLVWIFQVEFPAFIPKFFIDVQSYSLFTTDFGWLSWLLCFVAVDFFYYWQHRILHLNPFLFAEHAIHHTSKEFNFSTSLRVSWWMLLYMGLTHSPLILIGFNPLMVFTCMTVTWLYQHIIHFDRCKKLGPLETFLVTPTHHRVHHGYCKKYFHKNFGGVFIVWDRIFGTFAKEEEKPAYGMGMNVETLNPFWLQLVFPFKYIKKFALKD